MKEGKLYHPNNVISSSMSKQNKKKKSLKDWHEILELCNLNDVLALENITEDVKIGNKEEFDSKVCVKEKLTQGGKRKAHRRANVVLELVHSDLTG